MTYKSFYQTVLRRTALLLVALLLAGAAAQASSEQNNVILVFGDSLSAAYRMDESQGWAALLQRRLAEKQKPYRVVNGSVSGETTAGGLARLPAMLETHQPDIVILELGGNDGLRGLPVASIRENLLTMVRMAQDAGASVLLAGIQIPPNYGPRYTEPFYQQFHDIAEQEEVAMIPFLLEGIADKPALMQDDGIHPTAEAQELILENVWPTLKQLLD